MTTSRAPATPAAPASGAPAKGGKLKPAVFGRYLLLDRVAAGGMAEVWRAKQFGAEDFQRIIAIKKILPHVVEDPEFIQMFKDEAKITVQLQHANIGQVYELNKVDETFYIAMEYISGKDAKTVWGYQRQRNEPLPIPLSCFIVQKMCEGLDYAHRKKDNFGVDLKIVHRDVSPQNVLISWEGEVKVIDFGIAKAAGKASKTQAGILKGKFGYMAPEQIRGMPIDQRADVFALGVCLYEMVTGERAFVADSDFSLLEMVRNVEIKPPSLISSVVPPEVERIIYKAMAKDPEDRYQWGSDMSEDLQRFMLMQGKSPTRNDLAEYLRNNFPADYDRERLRMESYRDIEMPEVAAAPPAAAPAKPATPQLDSASAAVMAAMADDAEDDPFASVTGGADHGSAGSGSGSTPKPAPAVPGANPSTYVGGGPSARQPTQTGIRPAAQLAPAPAPLAAPTPPPRSGTGKLVGIAAAIVLAVVGIAAGAAVMFKGTGSIAMSVQPDGSEVFLDGVSRGAVQGGELTLTDVPVGPHVVRVVKEKFVPMSVNITLARNQVAREQIRLDRMPDPTGVVSIRSKPGGAAIWVDGADSGKVTPADVEMSIGEHRLELKLARYKKSETKLAIDPDAKATQEVTLRPQSVDFEIKSMPPGAKIFDQGKQQLGVTPWVYKDLAVDPPFPQIVLKRAGCQDYPTSIAPDEAGEADQGYVYTLTCKK
ncbi:MAG: serine/threonine protein kinase [Deltaproteobacteria bacterium]|nr:serine/threonine protein kinase [Deltaproteobacteria bacterium]